MSTSRSIVYTLLASLALAVALFPTVKEIPGVPVDPYRHAVELTRERYATQSELLRRAHSRVLASAAVAKAGSSAEPVVFVRPSDVPAVVQDRFRAALGKTLAPRRRDPRARVVITFAIDTGFTIAGERVLRPYRSLRSDVFPPRGNGDGVCAIVARASDPGLLDRIRRVDYRYPYATDLGSTCRWYLAYGTPGLGVATWLDSTNFEGILGLPGRRLVYVEENSFTGYLFIAPQIAACWARREGACAALVLQPTDWQFNGWNRPPVHTPGWIGESLWAGIGTNGMAAEMLTGIERELGPEGFAAFWKSDQPLPVAFAAARGESLDAWFGRHFRRDYAAYPAGPLPAPRVSIAWLIAVPGLLGLGVLGVVKRGSFA